MIELGVGKRDITPQSAVRLSGFAERKAPFESVKGALFVRVHAFATGAQRVVLIYGDLIWWGSDFIETLRPQLAQRFQMEASAFVFIASHNHSGPATSRCFTDCLERADDDYEVLLAKAVHASIEAALANLEPVQLTRHRGHSDLGVYRRKRVNGRIEMHPDEAVEIDRTLSLIALHRLDGSLKGLMVHHACHPTLSRENHLHTDYPGVLLRLLDETAPGCLSLFLQGCAADVRPNRVHNGEFVAGDYAVVLEQAQRLLAQCTEALSTPGEVVDTDRCSPRVRQRTVRLEVEMDTPDEAPEETDPDRLELHRQRAAIVRAKTDPSAELLLITAIHLAPDLQLIGFNAEVSQHYQRTLQSILPGALGLGYCNGMIGYVCSREQILEGGYEPIESVLYFGLAGPFAPTIQSTIEHALDQLLKQDSHSKGKLAT